MSLRAIQNGRNGLNVAERKLASAAHNAANMNTEGFHSQRVSGIEESAGVRTVTETRSKVGVDPVNIAVETTSASRTYTANLQIIKAADDLLGETMDLLA